MSPVFPLALKLEGRACLVVGNGEEARSRALALALAGARVNVVGHELEPNVRELAGRPGIELFERRFRSSDLDGVWLAVLADRDRALAERMNGETAARRIFFCAVDQPEVGSFSHVAIARAGIVFAAVGTHGQAPALGRRLRELFEAMFDAAGLEAFAERLADLRRRTPSEKRREVLAAAVSGVRLEGRLVVPPEDETPGA